VFFLVDNLQKYHHLTHPQKRIWYIEQIYPNTALHNLSGSFRMKCVLDFALLKESINALIKRHDGLRLQFIEKNGEVKQYVNAYQRVKLDLIDFSGSREPWREFDNWAQLELRQVFDLYDSPLFHFTMIKIADDDGGYFVRFHHLIADGWFINIMTEQICDTYKKLLQGISVDEAVPSYLEYIEQERKYLISERFAKDRQFWNEKFSVLPEYLCNNKSDDISSWRKTYHLTEDRSIQIKSFCNQHKISLNTFFTAAFLIYRFKITQQDDIILGIPVLNRSGQREKKMAGMFTSSMPFRITLTGREDVSNFLGKINHELLNCYFHQRYPYNLLAQDLELKKKGFDNLYDICINYFNTKPHAELNGLSIENIEFHSGNQIYALQLVIKDWSNQGNLTLDFDYRLSDYDEPRIEKMYHYLNNVIDQLLTDPDMEINQVDILSPEERQSLLVDFNVTAADYPRDKTIHQLFEAQVQKAPYKTAISFGNQALTYLELNKKANQLARLLRNKGIGCESIVGLLTTHSLETVIGIMGVLKAGGAYLPIDPDNPVSRIRYLLDDAQVRLLLTNCPMYGAQELNFNGEILDLRDFETGLGDGGNLPPFSQPDNLVYVIYTSGSTGRPKGVMIEHRGLVNYIWWANKVYTSVENEVFALYSSLAFDLTVTSIFTPLIGGHQIYICEDDETDFIVDKILLEKKATIIKLTPAHLSLLLDRNPGVRYRESPVRCFIVGGEDLKTSLAADIQQSFGGRLEIYNEYGPTETVVGCMIHRYDSTRDQRNSVPIGIPADNVQIYLLDKYRKPVPAGVDGELYISGDGVARGYLKQRELTGEHFVENPFTPGPKMYRTGDLARFLDDGGIEYRGRVDYQVKIHGHRIELGEIEACLVKHPSIKEAIVIDRTDTAPDRNHGRYLCAYYISRTNLPAIELRSYLAEFLPGYMIPQYLMLLPELPLTLNGKVNRSLLPEPQFNSPEAPAEGPGFGAEKEAFLAKIVAGVLNIDRVRLTDNFLQLGGDSIKAIQIAARLKERDFKLKVKDILAYPVIAEMVARMETNTAMADQEPGTGLIEPTPIMVWFFNWRFKNANHWNQSVLLNLAPQVDTGKLDLILDTLIKHHDSLRINFNAAAGKLYYNPAYLTGIAPGAVFHLAEYSAADQDQRIKMLSSELQSGLNLENGLLFKAALFDCGPRGSKLLLIAHHLIIDGISWRIILDDLTNLSAQAGRDQALTLPLKTVSYQKWAAALVEYSQHQAQAARSFWESVANDDFQFPVDHDSGEDVLENRGTFRETLGTVETEVLLTTVNLIYHTEPNELLVIALALTISDWIGETKVVFELEGHGREEVFDEIDLSRTVGWFTSIYPVRLEVNDTDLTVQIKSLKEQLRAIPNKGFDFGVLKYLAGVLNSQAKRLIRFNYLGDFENTFRRGFFEPVPGTAGLDSAACNQLTALMDINTLIVNRELQIEISYSRNKFADETVRKFGAAYLNRLRNMLEHCRTKERVEFTPADFDTVNLSQSDLDGLFV
jgi:amino acid adenylation domain-containing protein/non-ribosomal peptide synthase protein (TIGR01720 family)